MATIIADDSDDLPSGSVALLAMPWLSSVAAHAGIVLLLALSVRTTGQGIASRDATSTGLGLDATTVAWIQEPNSSQASFAVTQPGQSQFYDDDAPQPPEPSQNDVPAASVAPSASLARVLAEAPPLDLLGDQPAHDTQLATVVSGGGIGRADHLAVPSGGSPRGGSKYGSVRTSVFGIGGEGHKFVYIFDRSASMDGHGGTLLAAAKAELLASLRDLGQTNQFQIIFYNDTPHVFNVTRNEGALVFGNDHNKRLAEKFVGGITADGATEHVDALLLGLRLSPDVIFFLTDAQEPRLSAAQLQRISKLNRGTSIHTIEFGYGVQDDSNNFLVKLARENNGQHVYVDVAELKLR